MEVLADRFADGSGSTTPYTPASGTPGAWCETFTLSTQATRNAATMSTPSDAVTPNWGNVTPFTLTSGSQFRQTLPGGFSTYSSLLASAYYAAQATEVQSLGKKNSRGARSQDRTEAAWFWANDLNGTYKPPGQLLQHTYEVAMTQPAADSSGDAEDFFAQWSQQGIRVARLYAAVSLAMADAAIAAWDQKYLTSIDLWRPVDAIQQASTDGNAGTTQDAGWVPLSSDTIGNPFSPCFPAWVSGHATFGGAWSRAMENEFEDVDFDDPFPVTLSTEDFIALDNDIEERTFDSFAEAGEENAESRIWLGVHYRVDAVGGLATGRSVADHVDGNELRPTPCTGWDCAD